MSSPSLEPIDFTATCSNFSATPISTRRTTSPARGVFIQNQFGGTFGGPIKKDKVFFFGDYQGTRQILGQSQSFPVPSLADRGGDLSDQASSFSNSNDSNGNPIANPVNGTNWATILQGRLGGGHIVNSGEPYYYTAGMVNPETINPNTGAGTQYLTSCTTNDPVTGCVFPNAFIDPTKAWDPGCNGHSEIHSTANDWVPPEWIAGLRNRGP